MLSCTSTRKMSQEQTPFPSLCFGRELNSWLHCCSFTHFRTYEGPNFFLKILDRKPISTFKSLLRAQRLYIYAAQCQSSPAAMEHQRNRMRIQQLVQFDIGNCHRRVEGTNHSPSKPASFYLGAYYQYLPQMGKAFSAKSCWNLHA